MNIIRELAKYFLYMVMIFLVGRLSLFIIYYERFSQSEAHYLLSFVYGLRMDTIVASMLLVIPLVIMTFTPRRLGNIAGAVLKYYFLVVLSILIYIENATFPFFAQYDVRPNYLFVEYLKYPKEVFGMLFAEYKIELSVAFLMIGGFAYLFLKHAQNSFATVFETPYTKRLLLFVPLALLLFIGIRSSLGHRPANNSDAMYSTDRVVNEITKNSLYSIGYSIYAERKFSSNVMMQYGKMDIQEAMGRVKTSLNIQSDDKDSPFRREVQTNFKAENPKNLVIFLQESMGYQFVEAIGGEKGITPNLNRLAKESILFKNLHSNGTRSVRGVAGVVAGSLAVPGQGVVKRNKSQSGYFTIASLLKPHGYRSMFFYGGESRFDNMRGWFLGNGFDDVVDEPEFENPNFVGTWGVCDEEVVDRANEEFKRLYAEKQKFAAVIFSTTNHSPFDFPDGKIELLEGIPKKSVKNAIKYADFAIGKLIESAKKETYYKDTVFVVISDHNVRVYGDDMVPVDMFKIPAIILGGGIEPRVYENLATQPDVLSTALDLLGLDLAYPIMGHSIFSDKKRDISLMQFNDYYALRSGDKVAVIRPGKEAQTFLYENRRLKPAEHDLELEKDTLAFVVTLNHIYNKKLYN